MGAGDGAASKSANKYYDLCTLLLTVASCGPAGQPAACLGVLGVLPSLVNFDHQVKVAVLAIQRPATKRHSVHSMHSSGVPQGARPHPRALHVASTIKSNLHKLLRMRLVPAAPTAPVHMRMVMPMPQQLPAHTTYTGV